MRIRFKIHILTAIVFFSIVFIECAGYAQEKKNTFRDYITFSDIFQPDLNSQSIKIIEKVYSKDSIVTDLPKGIYLVKNNIPYYLYWQNKKEKYVFHPMALGRYIFNNAETLTSKNISNILECAVELPNGGIAFYYPKQFNLARFVTPYYQYSALGMAELLGSFIKLHQKDKVSDQQLNKVWKSLIFPYKEGGVNLNDQASLEMPIWGSPPEVVLNGWIYTLLRIADYYIYTKDKSAKDIFASNIKLMIKILKSFDGESYKISRYSNSQPYKVNLSFFEKPGNVFVEYLPHKEYLNLYDDTYKITLGSNWSDSVFDTKINSQKSNTLNISVTFGALYDTKLVSNKKFILKIDPGIYSPYRASPSRSDKMFEIKSTSDNGKWVVLFDDNTKKKYGVFLGFPTNFSTKANVNYYHVFHYVALSMLAETIHNYDLMPYERNEILRELKYWANKWKDYTKSNKHEGLKFASEDDVLQNTNASGIYYHGMLYN